MQCATWSVSCAIVTLVILNVNYVWGRSVAAPRHHAQRQSHTISPHFRQTHHADKIARTNSHNKTLMNDGRRQIHHREKKPIWKTLTNTLTQVVLGDDDDYDTSSSSDSRSESDRNSLHSTRRPSRWSSLASSALAGLVPRIWAHLTSKNKKAPKKRIKTNFQITTFLPLQMKETDVEEAALNIQAAEESKKKLIDVKPIDGEDIGEVLEEEVVQNVKGKVVQDVAEGLEAKMVKKLIKDNAIAKQLYEMAARREDLALLEQKVTDSGRRLSFIEYAAILEIVVLSIIAAGVFRIADFPVPMSVFAKV